MVLPDRTAKCTITSLFSLAIIDCVTVSPNKTNIRQSYAAVFKTEQSPPMNSLIGVRGDVAHEK